MIFGYFRELANLFNFAAIQELIGLLYIYYMHDHKSTKNLLFLTGLKHF